MILNISKMYSDMIANARDMMLNCPKECCMFESTKDAEKMSSIFMIVCISKST